MFYDIKSRQKDQERLKVLQYSRLRLFLYDTKLLLQSFKRIMSDRSVVALVCGHATVLAVTSVFSAFYGQMIRTYAPDTSELVTGILGCAYFIGGGFGGVIVGKVLDKSRQYKNIGICKRSKF